MKINEMIMVIENRKGSEINSLCSFEDYLSEYVFKTTEDEKVRAELVGEIVKTQYQNNSWSEIYTAANHTIQARYCKDLNELRVFMSMKFNAPMSMPTFGIHESSAECLEVLRNMGLGYDGHKEDLSALHYEKIGKEYVQGNILHNYNGKEYRVLEKLSDRNLLLQDIASGLFVVAVGTDYFARYPKADGVSSENCEYGIEWQHGVYLGYTPSEIDFKGICKEYGEEYREERGTEHSLECREEMEHLFDALARIANDRRFVQSVRDTAKNALYNKFGTARKKVFLQKLDAGVYNFSMEYKKHKGRVR